MKQMIYAVALVVGVSQASAQNDVVYVQPPAKKKLQYDEAANAVIEVPAEQKQPIYIMNNQKLSGYQGQGQTQAQVQEQPTTTIEASPLRESKADQMRRIRQNAEASTEAKIVEKLEEARMEDERARADRLFGNGFGSGRTENAAAVPVAPVPVVVAPQPVQVVTPPAVVAVEEKQEEPKVDVKEEIRAAISELNEKQEEEKSSYYVGAQVGMSEYPDVVNIRGNVSSGFTLGVVTPERVIVEGSFVYSTYDIEVLQPGYAHSNYYYPPFKEMQQYNIGAGLKYQLLPGRLRPTVGALVSYTHRKYTDKQYAYTTASDVSTNAFDIGFQAGVDFLLTKNFMIGVDFRYLTNVAYRENNDYQRSFVNPPSAGNPVEKLDYYTGSLVGKFTF